MRKIRFCAFWIGCCAATILFFIMCSYFPEYKWKIPLYRHFFYNANLDHESLWTIHPIGRLGNLMGEYATLYALSKLNGHQAYILPKMHKHLSKIFKVTLPVMPQDISYMIQWAEYDLHDWMSPEYYNIQGNHIKFTGYPCSWTFYHDIREQIRREFSFHDFIKQDADNHLRRLKTDDRKVTFVGVHVRRGDYINIMRDVWKGVIADKTYLQKAMDYFRDKYDNTLFVVTSNDMDWCRANIDNFFGDVRFVGDGKESSPANDFALLAHCNHTIMTIGTFGFWVGYLAGGETIYLSNFTLSDSEFLQVFKYEAAYLPEWIGIPADLSPLLTSKAQPLHYGNAMSFVILFFGSIMMTICFI